MQKFAKHGNAVREKNVGQANAHKEAGNEAYKNKKWSEAVNRYTEVNLMQLTNFPIMFTFILTVAGDCTRSA